MPAGDRGPHDPTPRPGPFDGAPVLVTGATGFIGGHLVALLDRLGAEVHAIHRNADPLTAFDTPVRWHRADLSDPRATRAAVAAARPEHVIHLASLVKGARDPDLLLPMFEANVASTVNVLEAARSSGVRRVQLAGSLEEPEPGGTSASPYALSKAAAHLYGDYYRDSVGLEVVNLQIFMVYGPATPDETKLVPYVIGELLAGRAPEVSSGTRPVDWVHVGDVAEGIARCALVATVPSAPVPLGTGRLHTVRQVVETLVELSGVGVEPRFGSRADRSEEVVRAADVARTRAQLGWAPTIDLSGGLADTLAWYRARATDRS
jgi:nucleoside-diphosphate-sugar epimerase